MNESDRAAEIAYLRAALMSLGFDETQAREIAEQQIKLQQEGRI